MFTILGTVLALLTLQFCSNLIHDSRPSTIVATTFLLTLTTILYMYYKLTHRVTEESLIVFRKLSTSSIASNRILDQQQSNHNATNGCKTTNNCIVHVKKYHLRKEERKILPLSSLRLSEIITGNKILYRLYSLVEGTENFVEESTQLCYMQDITAGTLDLMKNILDEATLRRLPSNIVLHEKQNSVSPSSSEAAIFTQSLPRLDCLEYIFLRIKTFIGPL